MRAEETGFGLVGRCDRASRKCAQHRRCNKLHRVKIRAQQNMTRSNVLSNEAIEIRKNKSPAKPGF